MIVNLEENQKESNLAPEKLRAMIEKNFLTESGRKLARSVFLNQATEVTENTEKKIKI
jgi:hypothetical protein